MVAGSPGRWSRRLALAWAIVACVLVYGTLARMAELGTYLDPTEYTFAVTLRNDTGSAVVVEQCGTRCDSFHERDRLVPGATVPVNTSSEGVDNWWLVEDGSGRALGCIDLLYDHKAIGAVVDLSARTTCPP